MYRLWNTFATTNFAFFLFDISLRITHKKLKIVQTTESYELFPIFHDSFSK